MGYRKITNLYKNKDILYFKECFALEKIHGTSAHVKYKADEDRLVFFSGGSPHNRFVALFDHDDLLEKFRQNREEHGNDEDITIYGEAYGGKLQRMSDTYGKEIKFIAFEVLISKDDWLDVERAHKFVEKMGLEFVHYNRIPTTEEAINAEMMADSVQAVRNGCGEGKMREGIVLRPVIEFVHQNGGRVISKHKRPEFAEREHTPKFSDPEKLKVLEEANAIAEEWVNAMRLEHVLQQIPEEKHDMKYTNEIIKTMIDDVYVEAKGEIVESKDVRKAIGKKTVKLFKEYLNNR